MTRLVSAEAGPPEPGDRALRPQTLSEFVGQAAAKSMRLRAKTSSLALTHWPRESES